VVEYYTMPPRQLAPSLKQSTGLFFNARPPNGGIEKVCGDWDADETDLLRKDTDKNGFFCIVLVLKRLMRMFCPI